MTLPLPHNYASMEAQPAFKLPEGANWRYEPKWDGFRCLVFRNGASVYLTSKAGKSLSRYFPELVTALLAVKARQFVLDGEIVISVDGNLSFDDLLMRIHPADSRIHKLSRETPAKFIAFNLLVDDHGKSHHAAGTARKQVCAGLALRRRSEWHDTEKGHKRA